MVEAPRSTCHENCAGSWFRSGLYFCCDSSLNNGSCSSLSWLRLQDRLVVKTAQANPNQGSAFEFDMVEATKSTYCENCSSWSKDGYFVTCFCSTGINNVLCASSSELKSCFTTSHSWLMSRVINYVWKCHVHIGTAVRGGVRGSSPFLFYCWLDVQ